MLMGDDPEIEATAGRRMNVIDDVIDARQTVLFWRAGLVPVVDQYVDRPSIVPPSMTVTSPLVSEKHRANPTGVVPKSAC
jgi:hypothetical protein